MPLNPDQNVSLVEAVPSMPVLTESLLTPEMLGQDVPGYCLQETTNTSAEEVQYLVTYQRVEGGYSTQRQCLLTLPNTQDFEIEVQTGEQVKAYENEQRVKINKINPFQAGYLEKMDAILVINGPKEQKVFVRPYMLFGYAWRYSPQDQSHALFSGYAGTAETYGLRIVLDDEQNIAVLTTSYIPVSQNPVS